MPREKGAVTMAKKPATAAINFDRIFALKDQLSRHDAADPKLPALSPEAAGDPAPQPTLEACAAPSLAGHRDEAESSRFEPMLHLVSAATPSGRAGQAEQPHEPTEQTTTSSFGTFRVGMPKALHGKLRALAALEARPVTAFVADLLCRTPDIDPKRPFHQLLERALAIAPVVTERVRIEVRMQVPIDEHVHTRLHQLAALRGQTLSACLMDVLSVHVTG
jgi:hypothetical protein